MQETIIYMSRPWRFTRLNHAQGAIIYDVFWGCVFVCEKLSLILFCNYTT